MLDKYLMNQPSDTPPDGDFVRYIERLTAVKPAAYGQHDPAGRQAPGKQLAAPASARAAATSARPHIPVAITPEDKALLHSFSGTPFLTHVKWVVGLWLGSQLLAEILPAAGFLFIPALVGYAGWVIFKANENSSGALLRRMQQLADLAAKK